MVKGKARIHVESVLGQLVCVLLQKKIRVHNRYVEYIWSILRGIFIQGALYSCYKYYVN